jgi:hypothetical protein
VEFGFSFLYFLNPVSHGSSVALVFGQRHEDAVGVRAEDLI